MILTTAGTIQIKVWPKASLLRGFARCDVTAMLLHRREWHADVVYDNVEAVTLHTDGSPNTGLEFQGMVAVVRKRDNSSYEITLPGATLAYGLQDGVSKTVTLLWAIWLMCGPALADILYFINKTTCICTDGGTELTTVETPNLLYAFMQWVAGTPFTELHAFARNGERLFPVAIRIVGWGHTFGNLMKGAAGTWRLWSQKLELVRKLVAFYKNKTWRNHVKKCLRDRAGIDLRPLDKCNADLAKWRYQTLPVCFTDLLRFRTISENEFRSEWFINTQERETLAAVCHACKDAQLWKFMNASNREVLLPLERCRRWGMVCTCPHHVQLRATGVRHINCYFNSRRLPEAWEYVRGHAVEMLARARTLTVHDCEGDQEVFWAIRRMLEYSATGMMRRSKYLNMPPHSFSQCGTRQGAKAFLDAVAQHPIDHHDTVTINLMHCFGALLMEFVDGADISPALKEGIRVFNLATLDESRGERYHKIPTVEKKRAPASTSRRLKQCTRAPESLKHMRRFRKRFGPRAKDIIRYEWEHFKRVLRPAGDNEWKPVQLEKDAFYARVYREDELADLNWNNVAVKPPPARPVAHDSPSGTESLHNEYVMALVEPGNHYSVRGPQPASDAGGEAAPQREEIHFRLINTVTSHSRPHTVPTVEDPDSVEKCASVAFEIQMETREPIVVTEAAQDTRTVSFEPNPRWFRPFDITDFESWNKTLHVWRGAEPSTSIVGCTDISCMERARVCYAVLDDRCPVLAIVQHLRNQGWNPVPAPIEHTAAVISDFDSTEAIRQKRYLQVVCKIVECMRLTSTIPSRQAIKFDDCLLRGIPVEPNMGNASYAALLNKQRQKDGKLPTVLALEDDAVNVLPDNDDDGIIGPGPRRPEPKPKAPVHRPLVVASRARPAGSS